MKTRLLLATSLLAASALIFGLTEILPGDAAQAILGQAATPENLPCTHMKYHLVISFLVFHHSNQFRCRSCESSKVSNGALQFVQQVKSILLSRMHGR